jgi:carbon-monoxide dehydrogenase large subunit
LAQIIADAVGVPAAAVTVATGDTATVPHGGGAWASRGAAIGGEAAWAAGRRLRQEILSTAAAILQVSPDKLDIRAGSIWDSAGQPRMTLAEFARTALFRGHELPGGKVPQLTVAHQYRRETDASIPTNGIQAALLEVDPDTGLVIPRHHWVVEDCGRIVNPLLVDEQIRGGVVQGIGEALLEACRYDEAGQFTSGSLADYLVPMALEMPDITIAHVETPYSGSAIGAKGAGEAGTCAAGAAILNAVNDALSALGARVSSLPITPSAVLDAIQAASPSDPIR